MAFITDTHKVIAFLQTRGYSREQAEGLVEVIKELETDALATTSDLKDLKLDMFKMMVGQGVAIIGLTVGLIQLLS